MSRSLPASFGESSSEHKAATPDRISPNPVASSLQPTSVLSRRFPHKLRLEALPLADLKKPLDPVTEDTPATPAAPPAKKGAWKPRRRMQAVVMEERPPAYYVHYTATNRCYPGFGAYDEGTRASRKAIEDSAMAKARDPESLRPIGFSASAHQLFKTRNPEEAMQRLTAALRSHTFELPPTSESLTREGITPQELSETKATYWFSTHVPVRSTPQSTTYKCTYRGTSPIRHYFMKVVKKQGLTNYQWTQYYLELQVLKQLGHACCGTCVRSFHSADELHTVVGTYVEQVALVERMQDRMTVAFVCDIVQQVVGVLNHLHTHIKVAYGGLRAHSVMVTLKGKVLILDFEDVICLTNTAPISASFQRVSRGTHRSAAQADVASIGCLLHLLLNGSFPSTDAVRGDTGLAIPIRGTTSEGITMSELHNDPWFTEPHTAFVSWEPPTEVAAWREDLRYVFGTCHRKV